MKSHGLRHRATAAGHSCRCKGAMPFSRCIASIASAATMRRMRSRWAAIPNREAPFFFQKNPDNLVIDGGDFPIRRNRTTCITRSSWWWRWQGRQGHPARRGAGLRLWLCRRPRHDAARPAGRMQEGRAVPGRSARPSSIPPPAPTSCRRARSAIPTRARSGSRSMAKRARTGDLNQMIWKVPEMISYLSGLFELKPGDLILSGTPSGVGAVKRGDRMQGFVEGVGEVRTDVV